MGKIKHNEAGDANGKGRTKLYMLWSGMRARCRDPKHISYKHYGAKGVKVCDEWSDFVVFRDWARESGYAEGLDIDREDANGHYEPNNCRWITRAENVRRTKPTYIAFGEAKTMVEWSEDRRCAVTYYTLRNRIQRGWDIEEAIGAQTHKPGEGRMPSSNWKGQPIKGRKPLKPRIKSLQK